MLDTRLSDAERYPLKVSDLVVMDIPTEEAPEKVVWASGDQYVVQELPNVAFNGDYYHKPMYISDQFVEYSGSVMSIDPSGRGKDEKVNEIIVESNFGDGMFNQLMMPILAKIHPVTMGEVRHNTQKEKRIIDVLEPVMNQHKLVMDKKLIKRDYESTQHLPPEQALRYQLMYQLTRITAERGALSNDDRLDSLAMAVQYWVDAMSQDAEVRIGARREEMLMEEVNKVRQAASMGLAVVTGHLADGFQKGMKW